MTQEQIPPVEDRNQQPTESQKAPLGPLSRVPPNYDPDSWEATKQVEEFNKRIRDFELEFTEGAKNFTYEAKDVEMNDEERRLPFLPKRRVNFPNRYAFSYVAYQRARVAGATYQTMFERVHEVWIYIQQAYTAGFVRPGPALLSKIEKLNGEKEKLQQDISDLTRKLQECETKRKWGITDSSLSGGVTT